jgi:hypothetical protein
MEFEKLWEKRTTPNYGYRPVLPHEKRLWKARFEPQIYEYHSYNRAQDEAQEKPVVVNITAGGILLLAFLELLNSLSNPEESGIEGKEEIETPQST